MQPIEGWFETDRCILTCMSCFGNSRKKAEYEAIAIKLCAIRDYLQYRRIQCIPLVRISLNYLDNDNASLDGSNVVLTGADKLKPNKESKSIAKDSLQEISFLQKFRNMIELKKESYEIGKRQKCSAVSVNQNQKSETSSYASIQNPLDLFRKLAPSKTMDQLRGKTEMDEMKASNEKSSSEKPDDSEGKKEIKYDKRKSDGKINTLRKRVPLLNEIGRMKTVEKDSEGSSSRELETTNDQENCLQRNFGSSEEVEENPNILNLEPPTGQNKNDVMERQLKQMTEVAAMTLVTEKCKVSQLNITSSPKDQARSCGGWIYCGLEKDTVILQKAAEENLPFQSYLGKGMVPYPPNIAFEALRTPQNRRTYDDMLQKAEILHEFQCGMKIVYQYYEVHQMSEKRYYDICLLQGEKIDGKKYIITLQSVEWPKCKELENVTRVKMTSSGWIIEPVIKGKEVSSMITYISQMDLGSSQGPLDTNNLAAKQPLCIVSLRQHLMKMKESYNEQQKELS